MKEPHVEGVPAQHDVTEWLDGPLWQPGPTTVPVSYGPNAIERILPQRSPFLLVDAITRVDLRQGCLRGHRWIDPSDPVFAGRDPGEAVYPCVLQLLMMAELACCLLYFRWEESCGLSPRAAPGRLEAFGIRQAAFPAAVLPGDALTLLARCLVDGDASCLCASQLLRAETVCAIAMLEVGFRSTPGPQPRNS